MIDRACISINNCCNLSCGYCHFHTPQKLPYLSDIDMDIYSILNNITNHIDKYGIKKFKLGFVGNGEPMLDYDRLKTYIEYISAYLLSGQIAAYTITNGTILTREMLEFFKRNRVNVGISIDGIPEIHNKYRCNTHTDVIKAINLFYDVNGCYPSMNCTVSKEVLERAEETINFFEKYDSKVTFSRMIGENGISLSEYRNFLCKAETKLNIRRGDYDCTMYGGKCAAGINNIFYANGKIYLCGNCVDLPTVCSYKTPIDEIKFNIEAFDRNKCYREEFI